MFILTFFFNIHKTVKSEYWLCYEYVCLSIHMEQHLALHLAEFHEIDIWVYF
jgi:hypothetical protein